MESGKHLLVAAIDFGTTYSGYAFSLLHEFKKDPTKSSIFTWTAAIGGFQSLKTSTCVLFDDKRKFHSFGFEAEDKYSNLALDNEHHNWLFFRRFKMQLYKETGLKRNFALESDNGLAMDAMEVFSAAIRYLKGHLLEKCRDEHDEIHENDILFVLTVPAIWSDQSKQFMREAAEKAGIEKRHLLFALEPEAASLFCKHVPVEKLAENSAKGFDVFRPGSKYIILDAGGGTIDITVHEVGINRKLKEIHKANGGAWGGTSVDEAFRALLEDLFGENVIQEFSKQHKYDMLEVFTDFEVKKRTVKPGSKEKITLRVPISLTDTFRKLNEGKEFKSALEDKPKYAGRINLTGDKMRLDPEIAKGLFTDTMDNILYHMKKLMQDQAVKDAKFILMVGGFSESPMLRHAIRETFQQKKVVIPSEAGLSVVRGAAIFGHSSQEIEVRISKYTYGLSTSSTFDEKIHDARKNFTTSDGRVKCRELFDKHVTVGNTIKVGCPQVEQGYSVVEPDQTSLSFSVYTSKGKNPLYVTGQGCSFLGSLKIDVPGEGLGRGAGVTMTFSGTELQVEATNKQTGESVSAAFDLLD